MGWRDRHRALLPLPACLPASRSRLGYGCAATVLAFGAAVPLLAITLLARSDLVWVAALAVGALFTTHVTLVLRLISSRRKPMNWTAWHAMTSVGWLGFAVLGGVVLAVNGGQDAFGARLAAAYGVAAIAGWMSNLILGVSYKLFPGFVAVARRELDRPPVPIATLSVSERIQPIVFLLFNAGTAAVVGALLVDMVPLLEVGGVALAIAALTDSVASARTLACAVVDPRSGWRALSVLPLVGGVKVGPDSRRRI